MPIFLFTDIEGSTSLWQQYPADMGAVIAQHDALLNGLVEAYGGRVVKNTGDGLFASFEQGDPLGCILEIQKGIARQAWGPLGELRVRAALHAGEAQRHGDDYFGLEVNRTARLLSAAWGGQILVSRELTRAVSRPPGISFQDLGLHLLKDLNEPQHLFALRHPDLPLQVFPPPRTLSAHPHNLPPQPTPFVGRTEELAETALRLSAPTCRLLTLLGPGGIGKTRLALQAAAAQIENFPHGVFFVPLAPLTSGDLLLFAIAEALKFPFYRRDQPKTQLLNYLHEKTLLLVMDNFEHLTEAAGLVAEILAAAPEVKVLATSRERLNLRDEQLLPVEGMLFPSPNQIQELDNFGAVKLFLQSARRTHPDFELAPEERSCVARICQLVQGTPLGLELAAGWIRSLSCQEIADEIEASLDFLETSLRDLPDRHRSLRAVFDYSWALLSESERTLLTQLSVFQGPFDRPAAEVIALSPTGRKIRLLSLLTGLVDKSLLRRNASGTYELHSLVRHYTLEYLESDPAEIQQTRNRHARYFLTLLQNQETALLGPSQPQALTLLTAYLDDIRAAWQWTLVQGQWEFAEAALEGLYQYLNIKNREEEALRLFEDTRAQLAATREPFPPTLALRVDVRYILVCASLSHFETAWPLLEPKLKTAEQLGLLAEKAQIYTAMSKIYWLEGNYSKSMTYEQQALEIYRQAQSTANIAACLDRLGSLAWTMGDYASARQLIEEGLEMLRPIGSPTQIARFLDHLGVVAREQGHLQAAQTYFKESQKHIEGLDVPGQQAYILNHLAGIIFMSGQAEEAIPLYEKSIALSREIGDFRAQAYNLYDLANLMYESFSDFSRAEKSFLESQNLFEALHESFGTIMARNGYARIAIALGRTKVGLEALQCSLKESLEIQNARLTADTLNAFAEYFDEQGKQGEAFEILSFLLYSPNMEASVPQQADSHLARLRAALTPDELEVNMARGQALSIAQIQAWLVQEICETKNIGFQAG